MNQSSSDEEVLEIVSDEEGDEEQDEDEDMDQFTDIFDEEAQLNSSSNDSEVDEESTASGEEEPSEDSLSPPRRENNTLSDEELVRIAGPANNACQMCGIETNFSTRAQPKEFLLKQHKPMLVVKADKDEKPQWKVECSARFEMHMIIDPICLLCADNEALVANAFIQGTHVAFDTIENCLFMK